MTVKNTADRWGPVSQGLHWLIVVLILAMGTVGLVMVELPKSPKYFWVYDLHKSTGITVLALVAVRLAWRLFAGAPRPVAGTPRWQAAVASVTHWAMYGLLFAIPLSGWLYDSMSGLRPLRWFGLFVVPKLAASNPALRETMEEAHELLFWALIALVLVHAGAALYHHLFMRDATLQRMLPGRRTVSGVPPTSP